MVIFLMLIYRFLLHYKALNIYKDSDKNTGYQSFVYNFM